MWCGNQELMLFLCMFDSTVAWPTNKDTARYVCVYIYITYYAAVYVSENVWFLKYYIFIWISLEVGVTINFLLLSYFFPIVGWDDGILWIQLGFVIGWG